VFDVDYSIEELGKPCFSTSSRALFAQNFKW